MKLRRKNMMKNKRVIFLISTFSLLLSLTSCVKTYSNTDYNHTSVEEFKLNIFQEKDFTSDTYDTIDYTLEEGTYFKGVNDPNFYEFNKYEDLSYEEDYYNNPSYYGKEYGATMKITRAQPSFASTGILSRLFDGYIFCDGEGVFRRIQFAENGYVYDEASNDMIEDENLEGGFNMKFPKELSLHSSYPSISDSMSLNNFFAVNLRGATNTSNSTVGWDSPFVINLYFDLYVRADVSSSKTYTRHAFKLSNLEIKADMGDVHRDYCFAGFYADVALSQISSRIVGFGLRYDLVNIPSAEGVTLDTFNILAYEVNFPFANWY